MAFKALVIKDSLSPDGVRLTTMEVTFPRIVLAEFNTHRTFSRNSASSRAIPVEKMLRRAGDSPFIPAHWGKNQKGMQAEQELSEEEQLLAEGHWLEARDAAIHKATRMMEVGVHKQITNRLLEPFQWHTVIVTSTEWNNWDGLRCSPEAQPEIKTIADMMREARASSQPKQLCHGEWHLPLVNDIDQLTDDYVKRVPPGFELDDDLRHFVKFLVLVCVGRCARVSYLTHNGERDPHADVELAMRLLSSGHMSPFEHAARPMTRNDAAEALWRFSGVTGVDVLDVDVREHFSGNLRGWVQARKHVKHEDDFLLARGSFRGLELPAGV